MDSGYAVTTLSHCSFLRLTVDQILEPIIRTIRTDRSNNPIHNTR